MKEIYDTKKIQQVLNDYPILDYFDDHDYAFFIIEYEEGETIIHPLKTTKYLLFNLQGTIQIHSILIDGSNYLITSSDDFTMLGDMEFVKKEKPIFFATAKTKVTMLALDIESHQEKLEKDISFLHFLLQSLAKKITHSSLDHTANSLEEKLIRYIHYQCDQGILTNIEETATLLHCSRRQVQRILKQLCDENKLTKIKKGTYRLN